MTDQPSPDVVGPTPTFVLPPRDPAETGAYSTSEPSRGVEASEDAPFPLIDGYEVESEIARGGMGVVYRARHRQLNRLSAIKMILGHAHFDATARRRFRIEAEAVAALEHPHVVRVFEFREQGPNSILVMEYLAGGSLESRFGLGRMTARDAAALLEKIATGVAAAHGLGIVHRDLKPGNVLFDSAGEPKVTDFGLAKRTTEADFTATDAVMGTPAYMAPEQAAGRARDVGPASDVWALGAMLYEAVSGRRPFHGASTAAVLIQVQSVEPPTLTSVPRDCRTIIERCLAKEPSRRYATASELAHDLSRFVRGEPILARPVGRVERVRLWAGRNPLLASAYILATLAVILGSLGSAAGWAWRQSEAARRELAEEQKRTEAARSEAITARDQVSREKLQTERALRQVEAARTELQRVNGELDHVNYLSTIDLAFRSSVGGTQVLETRTLLNDCNPKLRGWEWHYLDRLVHPELFKLAPDGLSEIERKQYFFLDAKFHTDGKRLFAVGTDPILRVWDIHSGKSLASVRSDSLFLGEIHMSRDGRRLLTPGFGCLLIWNAETLAVERTIPLPPMEQCRAWFTPSGNEVVVSPMNQSRVQVIDLADGKVLKAYEVPGEEEVWGAGFPDGALRLVTLDRRKLNDARPSAVRIRDVEKGAEPILLDGITASPGMRVAKVGLHSVVVDVSPDGKQVAVSGSQTAIWDSETRATRRVTTAVATGNLWFSPDGQELLASGGLRVTRIDAAKLVKLKEFPGHPEPLRFSVLSPNRKRVAAAGGQGQPLRVWDAEQAIGPTTVARESPPNGPRSPFSPDGSKLLVWEADGSIREYDSASGKAIRTLSKFDRVPLMNGSGEAVQPAGEAYSVDGSRILASARRDNDPATPAIIRVFDAKSGTLEAEIPEVGRRGGAHAFTADGSGVYISDDKGGVGVWNLRRKSYDGGIPGVQRIHAVSPCGRFLLTDDTPLDRALPERRAALRDARTGMQVASLEDYPIVNSLDSIWLTAAFTRTGDRVAVACPDLQIRIWDTKTGKLVSTIRDLSRFPKIDLAFTPDGLRLATIGFGVDLWDVKSGRPVLPRSTFRMTARSVAFTADGRTMLLGGTGTVLLTRIESGRVAPN